MCLPPLEAFGPALKGAVSEREYDFAQRVFNAFDCKTLGEYSDLYMKIDVLLLADIFEEFRVKSKESFDLDPCWSVSLPGLVWDAALKYTQARIELITDCEMLNFFEASKRGRFVFVNTRYARANHPGIPNYDASKPRDWILSVDANNLYGYAMCKPLPVGEY